MRICPQTIPTIQLQTHLAFIEAFDSHTWFSPWHPYYRASQMRPLIALCLLHEVKNHPHLSNFGELNEA
jgi:hypothetical protein